MARAAFDEMTGTPNGQDATRAAYAQLKRWLDETPADVFDARRSQAELFFRRIGITFAVYGDNESTERLIPFDIIPRVLTKPEWAASSAGSSSGSAPLNAFLRDVYGPAGMHQGRHRPGGPRLPQSPLPPRDDRLSRRRTASTSTSPASTSSASTRTTFYVLEDNARTPSGVSYMLENREVMMRLFPELFARHRVAPVENYPDALLATLRSVAPRSALARPDRGACSRRAASTRPSTSTPSWPTSSASSWSRRPTSSSGTTSSSCARRRARSAST